MPKTCVKTTVAELRDSICATACKDGTREALDKLEQLIGTMPITVCSETGRGKRGGSRGRSRYNEFISSCMKSKSGPVTGRMKECAAEWRNKK